MKSFLQKQTRRHERNRRKRYAEHMKELGRSPALGGRCSPRMAEKRARHERYLLQVETDKEQGLEYGRIARAEYRRACAEAARRALLKAELDAKRPKHKSQRRPWDIYRAARAMLARGPRKALLLKARRKALGQSRSEADQERNAQAMELAA